MEKTILFWRNHLRRTIQGPRFQRIIVFFLLVLLFAGPALGDTQVSANESVSPPALAGGTTYLAGNATTNLTIILFYNRNCQDCQKVLAFLPGVLATNPEVTVESYDIYQNRENYQLFQQYNERYNRPLSPVPAVFIGDRELVGYDEIKDNLADAIVAARLNQTTPTPVITPVVTNTTAVPETPPPALALSVIIMAALIDGINPCAFAVLTFLLVTIMAQQSRRKVLETGVAYIFAVFVFYFLSGVGLFSLVQVSGVSRIFSIVAATIALIAGILMIRDAFSESRPLMAIPESRKGMIDQYVRKGTIPAALVLGVLVGMFELPCTGGIYLAILSLLSQSSTLAAGVPLLLLYNLVFILPLLIILGVVYWGLPPERFSAFQARHKVVVRLCMAALMIGIAAFLLFTVLR